MTVRGYTLTSRDDLREAWLRAATDTYVDGGDDPELVRIARRLERRYIIELERQAEPSRLKLARWLIRRVSFYINETYLAWADWDEAGRIGDPPVMSWRRKWLSGRIFQPLALRLSREAATDQMVEEAWWG